MNRKEGKIFRNIFAEHILILPGRLKIRKFTTFLLQNTSNFARKPGKMRKGQIFLKFSCRTHFSFARENYVKYFLCRTHQILPGAKYRENTCLASAARWLLSYFA